VGDGYYFDLPFNVNEEKTNDIIDPLIFSEYKLPFWSL
jgi:hypothetical protein